MSGITILNLENGTTLNHSVALIEGETDEKHIEIRVRVYSSKQSGLTDQLITCWPVINGRFKVLVELQLGANEVHFLLHSDDFTTLHLKYIPPVNDRFVRLLYLVCNDDLYSGQFQGPVDIQCTDTQAYKKIILGAKLIQTFTSECFHRLGLQRRTFRLELDTQSGQPICHRFVLQSVTTAQAYQLSQNELWTLVKDELSADEVMSKTADCCKFLAFLSFTRYSNRDGPWPDTHQEILSKTQAHCALGGGGLALMGTGCLHTWPSDLKDVVSCFTDTRTIDRGQLLDDSAYRRTYWACYATTFGATCHELGHTFDLCHTADGIMGRGFDNMHKVFTLQSQLQSTTRENKTKSTINSFVNQIKLYKIMEKEWSGAFWTRETALWLYYQKWFNYIPKNSNEEPEFNGSDIRARHGIRVVILSSEDKTKDKTIRKSWDFVKGKSLLIFRLPVTPDIELLHNKRLRVIDSMGNTLNVSF